MKRKVLIPVLLALALVGGVYYWKKHGGLADLVLTGIVTTDEVVVSSQVQGRLSQLGVKEGDVVKQGQLLAVILPLEQKADVSFYTHTQKQSESQVVQAEADLKYQEAQTANQTRQAEANLAAVEASVAEAEATLENARLDFKRNEALYGQGVVSAQAYDQSRTTFDADRAHVESLGKQVLAARAAVALAQSNAQQVAARRATLEADLHQLAAVGAQKTKAEVQLGYTEIRAPIDGLVAERAALQGEVVNPGQPIVTLINPDNLWVRADVEETYIDQIRLGDHLSVRFPSGLTRPGTVFYRGVDASYATQRDVSRTKRDIKTFEIRVRVDNSDRRLYPGLTAYVTLPVAPAQ